MLDTNHQPVEFTLDLTYPPSINSYYEKGNFIKGKDRRVGVAGSAFRAEVLRFKLQNLKNPRTLTCRLSMEVELWAPDRRKRDIDNPLKCLFDALEYARLIENDEQIDVLVMYKRGVEAPGKTIVTLREI
jgi:crossover junction endodeoxyribonuclease RusA